MKTDPSTTDGHRSVSSHRWTRVLILATDPSASRATDGHRSVSSHRWTQILILATDPSRATDEDRFVYLASYTDGHKPSYLHLRFLEKLRHLLRGFLQNLLVDQDSVVLEQYWLSFFTRIVSNKLPTRRIPLCLLATPPSVSPRALSTPHIANAASNTASSCDRERVVINNPPPVARRPVALRLLGNSFCRATRSCAPHVGLQKEFPHLTPPST